jgi:hypothetical protein
MREVSTVTDLIITFLGPRVIAKCPWIIPALGYLIVAIPIIVVVQLVISIIRSLTADEHSVIWGLYSWKRSATVQSLNDTIRKLNLDSELKSKVIFLAKLVIHDAADNFRDGCDESEIGALILQILAGIPTMLRSTSAHRCSILVKDEPAEALRIYKAVGHSDAAVREMRLPL